jgi:glycerol-3-phosphate dehydrogenase subunit B
MQVMDFESAQNGIVGVWSEAAARQKYHPARIFLLATGGILGGGITGFQDGNLREMVFNLPLLASRERLDWFNPHYFDPSGQPIYKSGVQVNSNLQAIDSLGRVIFPNLYIIGSSLTGGDFLRERSIEGISLGTGYTIGETITVKG